jgi:hypothetical protein
MAIALGFGQGDKNTPMSGSTGGGSIQPKLQLNAQGQAVTDGSGGFLNYLAGLVKPQQQPAFQPPVQPPSQAPGASGGAGGQPAANTAAQGANGQSAAGGALTSAATSAALGGGL